MPPYPKMRLLGERSSNSLLEADSTHGVCGEGLAVLSLAGLRVELTVAARSGACAHALSTLLGGEIQAFLAPALSLVVCNAGALHPLQDDLAGLVLRSVAGTLVSAINRIDFAAKASLSVSTLALSAWHLRYNNTRRGECSTDHSDLGLVEALWAGEVLA
jgi:hypothetical protein